MTGRLLSTTPTTRMKWGKCDGWILDLALPQFRRVYYDWPLAHRTKTRKMKFSKRERLTSFLTVLMRRSLNSLSDGSRRKLLSATFSTFDNIDENIPLVMRAICVSAREFFLMDQAGTLIHPRRLQRPDSPVPKSTDSFVIEAKHSRTAKCW